MGKGSQNVQTSSYEINKSWKYNTLACNLVNNTGMVHFKVAGRVSLISSISRKECYIVTVVN